MKVSELINELKKIPNQELPIKNKEIWIGNNSTLIIIPIWQTNGKSTYREEVMLDD